MIRVEYELPPLRAIYEKWCDTDMPLETVRAAFQLAFPHASIRKVEHCEPPRLPESADPLEGM